jgi:tetratricopeptide (TPR) repeat protein
MGGWLSRLTIALGLVVAGCGEGAGRDSVPAAPGAAERRAELRAAVGALEQSSEPEFAAALGQAAAALGGSTPTARGAAALELGRLLDAHGQFDTALAAYSLALAEGAEGALLRLHRARMFHERGELSPALTDLARALELAPDRAALHWRLGLWQSEAGQVTAAERSFQRARELDPGDPSAPAGLARLWLEQGRPADAAQLLRSVPGLLELPYARHLLARALDALGDPSADQVRPRPPVPPLWSDPWVDELEELRVGHGEVLGGILGLIRAGRTDQATAALGQLLAERPDDVTAQGLWAAALARDGRPGDAVPLLRAAAERQPRHYRSALNLSLNLAAAGEIQAALEQARRAVQLHPGHAGAQFQLGRCAERAELWAEARQAYSRAQALGHGDGQLASRIAAVAARERGP